MGTPCPNHHAGISTLPIEYQQSAEQSVQASFLGAFVESSLRHQNWRCVLVSIQWLYPKIYSEGPLYTGKHLTVMQEGKEKRKEQT